MVQFVITLSIEKDKFYLFIEAIAHNIKKWGYIFIYLKIGRVHHIESANETRIFFSSGAMKNGYSIRSLRGI